MTPQDPSSDEQMAAVLSLREQWRLLLWMEAHPRALEHEVTTGQSPARHPRASRLPSVAYVCGLVAGTLLMLLRRAR